MKKTIFIISVLLLVVSNAFSQFAAITNVRENKMYCGVDNPIGVAVSNYPVKSIKLKITKGEGVITGENGKYSVKVKEPGFIEITVYIIKDKKEKSFGVFPYRVFPIPNPTVYIGGQSEGAMNANLLKAQKGIYAKLVFFDFEIKFEITSFNFVLIKKNGTIVKTINIGAYFSNETLDAIKNCEQGDIILIKDVRCKAPDDKINDLSPIFLNIN